MSPHRDGVSLRFLPADVSPRGWSLTAPLLRGQTDKLGHVSVTKLGRVRAVSTVTAWPVIQERQQSRERGLINLLKLNDIRRMKGSGVAARLIRKLSLQIPISE